ncbi:hypothetical protein [Ruminiclostridium papyrosolvens]|uniref:Uncharacterized protein n=1 Tax=Ruminiclostridium papyrosolvens C7 TaxID=1330534 RepID=U4QZF7_9FIRM|nr:hypothetical protein [Ruminiclostridium papyrosolvens]EPR09503.1 hypothetical protein L323_15775 [Ruminiclostridium papyrosolvens C7]
MYNPNNKQFVFKDSEGKLWNFYYDTNQGICYSIFSKRFAWSEPRVVQSEAYEQFYVEIDEKDCFHIIYQDKKGNIIYCFMQQNETVKALPVLTSKSHSVFNKHLSLIVANSSVHIFFIIEHNGIYMLSYQTITAGVPVAPKKVDNITLLPNPYTVVYDLNDDIYVFYHISDGKNNQIGYKKYSMVNKIWSEYSQITMFSSNSQNPRVVVDRNGIFHICYVRKQDKQFQLVYQQKIPDRNMWTSESILAGSGTPISNFSILSVKSSLVIYYLKDDALYSFISNDFGASFTKSSKSTSLSRQHICVRYKSNSPYEHVQADEIPASFVNGFKLMFTHDSMDLESGLNTDEMRAIITTELKILKRQVADLKEAQNIIFNNIKSLESNQQNMELSLMKEISKILIGIKPVKSDVEPIHANRSTYPEAPQNNLKHTTNPYTQSFSNLPKSREELKRLFADRVKKKVRLLKNFKGVWKLQRKKNK